MSVRHIGLGHIVEAAARVRQGRGHLRAKPSCERLRDGGSRLSTAVEN